MSAGAFTKLARLCRMEAKEARALSGFYAFTVPVRTQSEGNMRELWMPRAARQAKHRTAVEWMMAAVRARAGDGGHNPPENWTGSWEVTLTRIARAELDDDNLRSSMKAIRDQIAQELGVGKMSVPKRASSKPKFLPDDRDPRLEFIYRQDVAHSNQYAVRVRIQCR